MSADVVIRGERCSTVPVRPDAWPTSRSRAASSAESGRACGTDELDASGCAVAPGFIDVHTHYDAQVFWDPALRPSSCHGVTTVVAGNCGFTIAPTRAEHHDVIVRTLENVEDMDPATLKAGIVWEFETFPQYADLVRKRGTALNFTAYVGHSALRLYVMGDAAYERAATPAEIERMCTLVVGRSAPARPASRPASRSRTAGVDGKPVPSRFAERDEVEALFLAAGRYRQGRGPRHPGPQCSYPDFYALQPRTDALHLTAALRGTRRQAQTAAPAARGEPDAGRTRLAAGHAASADDAVHHGRRVQPERRQGLARPRAQPRGPSPPTATHRGGHAAADLEQAEMKPSLGDRGLRVTAFPSSRAGASSSSRTSAA